MDYGTKTGKGSTGYFSDKGMKKKKKKKAMTISRPFTMRIR